MKSTLEKKILDLIAKEGFVSFPDIHRSLGERGENDLTQADPFGKHQFVYWIGMSEQLADVISELLYERKIFLRAANPLIHYLSDGEWVCLPVLPNGYSPKRPLSKDCWVPAVLSLEPAPTPPESAFKRWDMK